MHSPIVTKYECLECFKQFGTLFNFQVHAKCHNQNGTENTKYRINKINRDAELQQVIY